MSCPPLRVEPGAGPAPAPTGHPRPTDRRLVLQHVAAGAMLLSLGMGPGRAHAGAWLADPEPWRHPRRLWITRPQTQETVRAVFWAEGQLQPDAYAAFNHLYRDIYRNQQHPIALGLLNLNYLMQWRLYQQQRPRPLVLLSGYRTRATNARVGGIEPNIHGQGLADDFIYEGLSLLDNYRLAKAYQVGGLGLYPERKSLHKDLGRLRSWITRGRVPLRPIEAAS